jgi:hypothetical protein
MFAGGSKVRKKNERLVLPAILSPLLSFVHFHGIILGNLTRHIFE